MTEAARSVLYVPLSRPRMLQRLAELPADERGAWEEFWTEVRARILELEESE